MHRLLLLTLFLLKFLVYCLLQPSPTPSADDWSKKLADSIGPLSGNGMLPEISPFRRGTDLGGDLEIRSYEEYFTEAEALSIVEGLNSLGNFSAISKRQNNIQFDGLTLTLHLPRSASTRYALVLPFNTACENTRFTVGLLPPKGPGQVWDVTTKGVTLRDLEESLTGVSDQDLGKYSYRLLRAVQRVSSFAFNSFSGDSDCKQGFPRPQLSTREFELFEPNSKRDVMQHINATREYIFGFLDRVNVFYLGLGLAYFFNVVRYNNNGAIVPFIGVPDEDPEIELIRRRGAYYMEIMVQYLVIDQISVLTERTPLTREIVLYLVHPLANLLFDTVIELGQDIKNALNNSSSPSGTPGAHQRRIDDKVCLNVHDFTYMVQHMDNITRTDLEQVQAGTSKGCPNQLFPVHP